MNTLDTIKTAFDGLSAALDNHASAMDALVDTKTQQIKAIQAEIDVHAAEALRARGVKDSMVQLSAALSTPVTVPAVQN